nr:glycosyltransferase [Butyrivibrio sp.]
MTDTPFFSIILPIYNVEKYLDRCMKSILSQSFSDYEVILVDDGSTDNSPEICDEYAGGSRIFAVHKENGGLSSARNAGLLKARGEYIFFLDSDDYISEGALETMHAALLDKTPDILKFGFKSQPGGEDNLSCLSAGRYSVDDIRKAVLPLALKDTGNFILSAWSHIYKRSFLNENRLTFVSEREIGSEDYLFNLQAFLVADSLLNIGEVLYNYDYREGSLTKRYRKNLPLQYKKLYELMLEAIKESELPASEKAVIEGAADDFYLRSSFYVVMKNERIITEDHSENDRDKNIREI